MCSGGRSVSSSTIASLFVDWKSSIAKRSEVTEVRLGYVEIGNAAHTVFSFVYPTLHLPGTSSSIEGLAALLLSQRNRTCGFSLDPSEIEEFNNDTRHPKR